MNKEILIKQLFRYITHFDEQELTELLMTVGYIMSNRNKEPSVPLKSIPKEEIHTWLRQNLNHYKIPVAEFASMCGIHRFTVYRYLNGASFPTQNAYEKMAKIFEFIEQNLTANEQAEQEHTSVTEIVTDVLM